MSSSGKYVNEYAEILNQAWIFSTHREKLLYESISAGLMWARGHANTQHNETLQEKQRDDKIEEWN